MKRRTSTIRTIRNSCHWLIDAVNQDDSKWLKKQLENGASVNSWNDFDTGNSLLHYAIKFSSPEITTLLVKHGADLQCVNKYGERALDMALLSGRADHARVLLSSGARPNIEMLSFLKQRQLEEEARLFYEFIDVCDWNVDGLSILHLAAMYRDCKGVQMALSRGASVNERTPKDGFTALHLASEAIDSACIGILLKHGADPNIKDVHGSTALHKVTSSVKSNPLNQLLVIRMLVETGAYVNEVDNKSRTTLFFCASNANVECTEFLISKGAIPNIKSACNRMPLYVLMQNSRLNEVRTVTTAKLLLDAGAKVDEICEVTGWTVLHQAARRGHYLCVELLLRYGAKANAQDKRGYTPLHVLFEARYIEVFIQEALTQSLLDFGADVNQLAKNGETTALHCAWTANAGEVIETILRHVTLEKARKWIKDSVMLIDKPCCAFDAYGSYEYGLHRSILRLMLQEPYWTYYYAQCDTELCKMQFDWLSKDDKLTYFIFITENTKSNIRDLVPCLEKNINDPLLERTYPIYCKSLRRKLCTIKDEIRHRSKAKLRLSSMIGQGKSENYSAAEKIVDYLSLEDVRNFALAAEPFVIKLTNSGYTIVV